MQAIAPCFAPCGPPAAAALLLVLPLPPCRLPPGATPGCRQHAAPACCSPGCRRAAPLAAGALAAASAIGRRALGGGAAAVATAAIGSGAAAAMAATGSGGATALAIGTGTGGGALLPAEQAAVSRRAQAAPGSWLGVDAYSRSVGAFVLFLIRAGGMTGIVTGPPGTPAAARQVGAAVGCIFMFCGVCLYVAAAGGPHVTLESWQPACRAATAAPRPSTPC